jgi:hypothetical protein
VASRYRHNVVGFMDVHHMIVLAETMNARLMHNEDGPKVSRALYEALFRAEAFNLDEVPYTPDEVIQALRTAGVPAQR